jgi:hypothetical protein
VLPNYTTIDPNSSAEANYARESLVNFRAVGVPSARLARHGVEGFCSVGTSGFFEIRLSMGDSATNYSCICRRPDPNKLRCERGAEIAGHRDVQFVTVDHIFYHKFVSSFTEGMKSLMGAYCAWTKDLGLRACRFETGHAI